MADHIKSSEGDYGVIRGGEKPDDQFKGYFWERVKRALDAVFEKNPDLAEAARERVERAPADTQTAFYHADPFEVAADLAGQREVTPEQKRRYIEAEERQDRPPESALRQSHPELREE
jgi:hypothetical protein